MRIMLGVREHTEGYPVSLVQDPTNNRLSIRAVNEGGNNETVVDLWELLEYLRLGPLECRTDQGFCIALVTENTDCSPK